MPGRHHSSWVMETGNSLYWFDAGESCAYTAYLLNIELLNIRTLFISHPHFDHVGGLPHLFWTLSKLKTVREAELRHPFSVYAPIPEQIQRILEDHPGPKFIPVLPIREGTVYQDENIQVEAIHNLHLGEPADGIWRSFSFRIAGGGKNIVFSGDLSSVDELGEWPTGADLMFMESGHHDPAEVCRRLKERNTLPRLLVFMHHGRRILANPDFYRRECPLLCGTDVRIADDGMVIEL